MRSRTKQPVPRADVVALAAAGLDGGTKPVAVRELVDGTFNTAYRVELPGGEDLVVKVAPPPGMPLLTYERGLLRTEARFYELARRHTSVRVPDVVHTEFPSAALGRDVLVMSALPGRPWNSVPSLGVADRRRLRRALGAMVAELHTVHGDRFGYRQGPPPWPGPSWRQAFLAMVGAVLADAERFSVRLVAPAATIRGLVEDNSGWLDEVTVPVLTHFDLWDGNLFVDLSAAGRDGPLVGGIIDAERAFWGDPHADFASLALFGSIEDDRDFLAGYEERGGRVEPGPSLSRRLSLYRTYLYLVMSVEAAPRAYGGEWQRTVGRYVAARLGGELGRLRTPVPGTRGGAG